VAQGTFHVALQRDEQPLARDAEITEAFGGKAHHHLGPAKKRNRVRGIDRGTRQKVGHHADVAVPPRRGVVDRDLDLDLARLLPRHDVVPKDQLIGTAPADQQRDPTVHLRRWR
jgi:hypothetical protein